MALSGELNITLFAIKRQTNIPPAWHRLRSIPDVSIWMVFGVSRRRGKSRLLLQNIQA
jgi:hypothetical protein